MSTGLDSVAGRDPNHVTVLMGTDIADITTNRTPVSVGVDQATHRLLVSAVVTGGGTAGTQYAEGDTTSPATGTLALGRYKATPPTLTDGQQYGLQLDSAGNLKVTGSLSVGGTTDNSAYTAGSSTGTPSYGFYHSTVDTVTDGRTAALGMTSKRAMFVNLQTAAGVETGIAAAPLQVSLANTGANTNKLLVTPDSVALPANQSVNVNQLAGTTTDTNSGNKSAGTLRVVLATDQPALTNALKVDGSAVTQPVSVGSLPLPTGASTEATLAKLAQAQGSTTSGQSGTLVQGSVTTSAPTYTNAQTSPLSLDTSGNLRVAGSFSSTPVADVAPVTQNVTVVDSGSTSTVSSNGQILITGSPTASSAASFSLSSLETVRVQVTGTWTGTLSSEISIDGGTTWFAQGLHQGAYTTSSFFGNFVGGGSVTGATNFRMRATATVTGTAVVKIIESINTNSVYIANAAPAGNIVSLLNSSVATLTSGSVFTGAGEDVSNFSEMRVSVFANVASATDGLALQQSSDNTNWDIVDTYTIAASSAGQGKTFVVPRQARYFRVVYTNGGTNQATFRLATILNRTATAPSSNRAIDAYTNETDLIQNQTFPMVYNGTTWDRLRGDATNGEFVQLKTAIPAGTNVIGHFIADSGSTTAVTSLPSIPAGTNVVGKVSIDQTTPGTTNLVALAANQSVNVAQINGVTTLMGNGTTGTGSQRVTIASDNTAFSVNANQGTAAGLAAGWVAINGEQSDTTGTFTNATQTTSVTATNLAGYGNVLISINGTYGTATAVFEGSDDGGTTWYTINEASRTDSSVVEGGYTTLTNTTRAWQTNNPGWDSLRIRSTAVASGTVNVRISPSAAPSAAGATVTLGAALPTGANVIGAVTQSGTWSDTVTQATAANLNATVVGTGTFSVQTTADVPGTGATNLGKAEDAVHASGDTGVMALTVANEALTNISSTDGDYTIIASDRNGTVHVAQKASTATLSNVAGSATSVTLLAANAARIGAEITNDSSALLYIKFGTTASTTSYTVVLAGAASAPFSYYELPAGYTGRIDGIWASATGNARVTEVTP